MAAKGTRATDELRRAGIAHRLVEYEPPERHGEARDERPQYGLDAAAALGVDPGRILKTLVADVDGRPACAIVPVDRTLDLKALADALGGRRAAMADPAAAEKATGYVVGGISPIAQRRRLPTVLDAGAGDHDLVLVSAGRRGLQIELAPADLVRATGAIVARIARAG
jgi:Cys-tRNA(Pro)/Cys-tRNA(Cys) deacylase